jgi:hypothetical protein
VIRHADRVRAFERQLLRSDTSSLAERLERYQRLFEHARSLRPDLGGDWQRDIEPDIELARILNRLSPGTPTG